ncbi:MAG TPA: glycosyltransferase family 4 protein [Mucilaginibacter sp.]|nr:glycosyltransferase family 4 protein [Mucilaginibacter sp.]
MNPSKNVLQFLCFRSPYGGSFFKSLLRLEETLKNDSIDMVYLFHEDTSDIPWVQGLIDEGKKIYFLSGSFYQDILTIKKIIAKHHIKYVHAHFAGTRQFTMFKIVKMFYKRDLIIIRHLRNHDKPRGLVGESLRKALNHVDLYIGCSESVAIEYRKNFNLKNGKVTYVTNAIDFNRLNEYEKLNRSDFYISSDTTVFLMFGFDYYRKGVDLVLEAMDGLVQQGHDVCLLLSLSVNRENIESKIKIRFGEIPEWLRILKPRDDIASYYNLSDYFISAAREEGFCNALVEAAYCERPIISSNIPGPQTLNIPHTYMFESEDIAGLQDAMLSLITLSQDKKEQIITEQKAYVEKAFDLDEWAQQIKGIYQTLN